MKVFLVILLIHVLESESKSFDGFEKTIYQVLNPEPFEVPPFNDTLGRGTRIVLGSQAAYGQFPHFALIFVKRPSTTVQCGAGLIKVDWLLTADHCVREAISIEVRLGLSNRDSYEQKVYAAALARQTDVDMALIKLTSNVRLTNAVKPALLPSLAQLDDAFVGKAATVSGMGVENQQTNAISNVLKYTTLRIMSQAECTKYFGLLQLTVMCAKHESSLSSTCPGDSGSPLVIYENSQPIVVGIVSFGAGAGCDKGYPVGYARVTKQLSWIAYYTELVLRS